MTPEQVDMVLEGIERMRPRLPQEGFVQREDEVAIGRTAGGMMPVGARALVEVVDYGHQAVVAADVVGETEPRTQPETRIRIRRLRDPLA